MAVTVSQLRVFLCWKRRGLTSASLTLLTGCLLLGHFVPSPSLGLLGGKQGLPIRLWGLSRASIHVLAPWLAQRCSENVSLSLLTLLLLTRRCTLLFLFPTFCSPPSSSVLTHELFPDGLAGDPLLTFLHPLRSGTEGPELGDNRWLLCRPLHGACKAGRPVNSSGFGFLEATEIDVGTFQAPADWNAPAVSGIRRQKRSRCVGLGLSGINWNF